MCGSLGLPELLIILAIVVLLFGASRLPQLGRALGDTVRNFKKGTEVKPQVEDQNNNDSIEAHEVAQIVEGEVEEEEVKAGDKSDPV